MLLTHETHEIASDRSLWALSPCKVCLLKSNEILVKNQFSWNTLLRKVEKLTSRWKRARKTLQRARLKIGSDPSEDSHAVNHRVDVISAKNHKRQRRKRQSVTAKRKKSQTPKILTAILTLPNLI